jgi:DNA polymerase III epsilon subunit family exonuclease
MFQEVLFPRSSNAAHEDGDAGLMLQRVLFFKPRTSVRLSEANLVVFDFETTGLDANSDRIIEIGALKVQGSTVIDEFHTLVKPDVPLSPQASRITGITAAMLQDQPMLGAVLSNFFRFIEGSILCAHNAEFDWAFLRNSASRLGYQLSWPCFCTLKMARALLPQLESKNLDTLAKHYQLEFEARHRSIGDCKVTHAVFDRLLTASPEPLMSWGDLAPYAVAAGQG